MNNRIAKILVLAAAGTSAQREEYQASNISILLVLG